MRGSRIIILVSALFAPPLGAAHPAATAQAGVRELMHLSKPGYISCYALSPDSRKAAYCQVTSQPGKLNESSLVLVDLTVGKEEKRSRSQPRDMITHGLFSADGKLLALYRPGVRNQAFLWDVEQWKETLDLQLLGRGFLFRPLGFSPDGKLLAGFCGTGEGFGSLAIWDLATGKPSRLGAHEPQVLEAPLGFGPAKFSKVGLPRAATFAHDGAAILFTEHHGGGPDFEGETSTRAWDIPEGNPVIWSASGRLSKKWAPKKGEYGWDEFLAAPPLPGTPAERYRFRLAPTGRILMLPMYTRPPIDLVRYDDGSFAVVVAPSGERFGAFPYPQGPEKELWRCQEFKSTDPYTRRRSVRLTPDGKRLFALGVDPATARKAPSTQKLIVWDVSALHAVAVKHMHKPTPKELDRLWASRLTGQPSSGEPLQHFWAALADEDPERAHPAMFALVGHPSEGVPLLRQKLTPPRPPKEIAQWLTQLDSPEFKTRERATRELQRLGAAAQPFLRQNLQQNPSQEARRRIEELLKKSGQSAAGDELRVLRCIDVLEHIDTPSARELLRAMSEGNHGPVYAGEAKKALQRAAEKVKR